MKQRVTVRNICDSGVTMTYRPHDMGDRFVLNEVFPQRAYAGLIDIRSTDTWLDIGAHIGCFALSIIGKVSRVICYEPEPDNFALLRQNLAENQSTTQIAANRAAVVGQPPATGTAILFMGKNAALYSLYTGRSSRTIVVPAIGINDAIRQHQPSSLKIDTEGAEVDILDAITPGLWLTLRQVIFEFHFSVHSLGAFNLLCRRIRDVGFDSITDVPDAQNKTVIVYARRD